MFSYVAETKSKFDSFRIANIENGIWGMSCEIKYFFLKDWNTVTKFLRLRSKLFHSIMADGKKKFWKSYALS